MPNAVVTLKKGAGRTLKQGGPWIYDNEIESIMGSFTDGDIVAVHDFDGYPLGKGFVNRNSKLTVRMMTRNRDAEIDEAFIRMRVQNAWEYRKKVMDDISSCRVIFGEADFLPGIVIDKFADVLVVESLALGIDRFKVMIVDILKELMEADGIHIRGVYERSDAKVREQEGMERIKGFIGEPFDTKVEIVENGVRYYVDVKEGQKTGFFLDGCWTALPTPVHLPSMRDWPGRSMCSAWTPRNWAWRRQEKMRNLTVFPSGWNSSARMCLSCSRGWRNRGRSLTWSSWIRRHLPSPEVPSRKR